MLRSYEAIGAYVHGLHRSMLNISASKPILITSTRINLPTVLYGPKLDGPRMVMQILFIFTGWLFSMKKW